MNGKIKTKFAALFAVALMITVCVVPMVGNDYGEAETVIIPTGDNELKEVTVEGYVYNAAGSGIVGAEVSIASSNETVIAYTDSNGKYVATVEWVLVKGTSPVTSTNITATISVGEKVGPASAQYANPAYGSFTSDNNTLTFTKVTVDKLTDVNFKAGYVAISGNLYYGNGSGTSGLWTSSDNVTVSLKQYNSQSGASGALENSATYQASTKTGMYTIYAPANLKNGTNYDQFCVVTNLNGDVKSSGFTIGNSSIGDVNVKSNTYLAAISVDVPNGGADVAVTADATSKVSIVSDSKSFSEDKKTMYYKFTLKDDGTGCGVKVSGSYGKEVTGSFSESAVNTNITYTEDKYFKGSVNMGDVPATGAVTVSFFKEDKTTAVTGITTTSATLEDGKYKVWYTGTNADAKYFQVKYDDSNKSDMTGFTNGESYDVSLSISSTGYQNISGKVSSKISSGLRGISMGITVANGDAFGLTSGAITTDDDGTYSFMAKTGSIVRITPDSTYTYDVASKQIEVMNVAITGVDFVMLTQPYTITVKDALDSDKGMKGAQVYYSLDYKGLTDKKKATWVGPIATDKDGQVKIEVDGNVVLTNIASYATYEGRYLSANVENPVYTGNVSTADKKYVVSFKDGTNVLDLDGLKLPNAVVAGKATGLTGYDKYEISAEYSLKLSQDGKSAYAYIPSSTSSEKVYLYNESKMIGNYYYKDAGEMVELNADSTISIDLTKYVASGYVKDDADKGLAGITVSIVDADGKSIGSGVTNSVGYYSFTTTVSPAGKVILSNTGVYTFADSITYVKNGEIKAAQKEYSGSVVDYRAQPIKQDGISITVVDEDGKTVSTAETDANGKFKVIAKAGDKVKASDNVFTFEDVTVSTGDIVVKADQVVGTFYVYVYDTTEGIEGIEVSLYKIYSPKVQDNELIASATTDKNGAAQIIYTPGDGYSIGAVAKSVEFGYKFSSDGVGVNQGTATIKSTNVYSTLTLLPTNGSNGKEIGSGYKVESFSVDGQIYTKVGEGISDDDGNVKLIPGDEYKVSGPEGALYTFGSESDPYVEADANIYANESIYTGTVKTKNAKEIEGITVTLWNADGESVGTGVTGEDGKYKIIAVQATKASVDDTKFDFGTFTFATAMKNKVITSPTNIANFEAEQNFYFGTYANGAVIKDVKVTYKTSDDYVLSATVIEDKYYIVTKDDLSSLTITATAPNFYASGSVGKDLKYVEAEVQKCTVTPYVNGQYAKILGLPADGKVFYGTVLTLAAQNEYSEEVYGEDGVIQKYKFAGWYINGEKVDEPITTYTVNGDCTIYADYKVSSYVAAPADESNGLSMDVLILGIVIVVLGLLAFAYAVKFKKE